MDAIFLPPTLDDTQAAATELTAALVRVPQEWHAAAWQDGLDLIAVLDGLKPICVAGRGVTNEAWSAALRIVALRGGLTALDDAAWDAEDSAGSLSPWYIAASERRRRRRPLFYLGRDAAVRTAAALSARGRIAPAEEAEVLGYPPCCVAAHHRRMLALEHLAAELAARSAGGDERRMARMIETGAAPLPQTSEDWRRYRLATDCQFAPFTSVAMCDACSASDASPAHSLSRRYRALAQRAGYAER